MLLEFSVANFLSFREKITFSMLAAPNQEFEESHIFSAGPKGKYELLKSAVIYGANASGKSNFFKAISFMKDMVLGSSKDTQSKEPISVSPFRLDANSSKEPSFFEIVFFCKGKLYRYGFETDREQIHSEWFLETPKVKEMPFFYRERKEIEVKKRFQDAEGLEKRTRRNALFLSVTAQFDVQIADDVLEWFRRFHFLSGVDHEDYFGYTLEQVAKDVRRKKILEFLKIADLGIHDILLEEELSLGSKLLEDLPEEVKEKLLKRVEKLKNRAELETNKREGLDRRVESVTLSGYSLQFLHKKDTGGKETESFEGFELSSESTGSQKLFALAGPMVTVLERGEVLVIDEFDASLHPLITRFLIRLFNSNITNPKRAQLIFATHDTNLLSNQIFRSDQIWFTEKDEYGATDLYSLIEYKDSDHEKTSGGSSYEKNYIQGKYGAIPFIGDLDSLLRRQND